jgi:predicted RNA-binding protein with PUA-like domain
MNRGDRVFVYHSGAEPGVVGLAEVVSEARDDPKNAKSAVVDVAYLAHLEPPTPLAVIKSTSLFNDWALVRQGRLSTMQAPIEFVEWIRKRYPSVRI